MRAACSLLLLLAGAAVPNDVAVWTRYGKNYAGWRHSELNQINAGNVSPLRAVWSFQTNVSGKFETTPLVFDRQMFITVPSNHAYALDAVTGKPIWHYSKAVPRGVNICCGQVNRGFAASGERLYKVN